MKSIILLFFFSLNTQLFAAVAPNTRPTETLAGLRLPLAQRLQIISERGQKGFSELSSIAFDESQDLETRWRAITTLGRVHASASRSLLEKALKSPDWYMRNAALIVAPYNNRSWALNWSRILLHDPALVVRTAAVQSLRQLNATEAEGLLWEKLYSSENYRSGESLWIRKHILAALLQFSKPGSEGRFISVLNDKDSSLHPIAMQALEKITRRKFADRTEWQTWHAQTSKKKI